jgi:hypothetical protein
MEGSRDWHLLSAFPVIIFGTLRNWCSRGRAFHSASREIIPDILFVPLVATEISGQKLTCACVRIDVLVLTKLLRTTGR